MATRADIMTRIHKRTATRARVRQQPDLGTIEDDEPILDDMVDEGCIQIAGRTGRLEAVATVDLVADQYEYEVPRGVLGLRGVYHGQSKLTHRDGRDVHQAGANNTGTPAEFGFLQKHLVITPAPSAEAIAATSQLTLYYIMASIDTSAADWPAGSSTEEDPADDLVAWLPPELENVLVYYVLSQWYEALGLYDDAQYFEGRYERQLQKQHEMRYDPRKASTTRRPARYF